MTLRRGTGRSGFTLVELLVAAALTLVLAAVVIAIATQVLASWRRANSRLLAQSHAALALELLARDLESVVWRRDSRVWLAATVQSDQSGEGDADAGMGGVTYFADWSFSGVAKPGWNAAGSASSSQRLAPVSGRLSDARFGMAGVWLRFVAEVPDGSDTALQNSSAVRAVSYQVLRRRVGSTSGATAITARRYALFRSEVRPFHGAATTAVRSSFGVGADLFAPAYNNPAAVIPGSTQTAGSGDAEPGGVRRPDRSQVLAENVVDFGVRFYGRTASGARRLLFPADPGGRPSENNRGFAATMDATRVPSGSVHDYAGEMSYGFPDGAEVMVRVLDEDGARQLEALELGRAGSRPMKYASDGEWWWGVVETHSEVYTRWIEIRSHAR